MTKRTCGECEHFSHDAAPYPGECIFQVGAVPIWLAGPWGDWRMFSHEMDATHCETFTLKQTRKLESDAK